MDYKLEREVVVDMTDMFELEVGVGGGFAMSGVAAVVEVALSIGIDSGVSGSHGSPDTHIPCHFEQHHCKTIPVPLAVHDFAVSD